MSRQLSRQMSPKIILWLAFAGLSSTWYALDPEAGGPFYHSPIFQNSISQNSISQNSISQNSISENPARSETVLTVAQGFDRPLAQHP